MSETSTYTMDGHIESGCSRIGAEILLDFNPVTYKNMHNYICRKKLCSNRKKTLGAMFGCEKFHQYVYRRSVILESNQSISH